MSINWVMLTPTTPPSFVHLPNESILASSPARTSLTLSSLSNYPAHTPFSASSPSGTLHLTNRRIVFLPANPPSSTNTATTSPSKSANTPLTSFAAPLTHVHDTRVTQPWLGPNVWVALIQPVPGGGLPAGMPAVEAKLTFKEGGAYDFHNKFCQVKERLAQVMEARAMGGAGGPHGIGASDGGAGAGVGEEDVHLEQLPAYEEVGVSMGGQVMPPPGPPPGHAANMATGTTTTNRDHVNIAGPTPTMTAAPASTPAEPPPGYEEAQMGGVTEEMERGLRFRGGRSEGEER